MGQSLSTVLKGWSQIDSVDQGMERILPSSQSDSDATEVEKGEDEKKETWPEGDGVGSANQRVKSELNGPETGSHETYGSDVVRTNLSSPIKREGLAAMWKTTSACGRCTVEQVIRQPKRASPSQIPPNDLPAPSTISKVPFQPTHSFGSTVVAAQTAKASLL